MTGTSQSPLRTVARSGRLVTGVAPNRWRHRLMRKETKRNNVNCEVRNKRERANRRGNLFFFKLSPETFSSIRLKINKTTNSFDLKQPAWKHGSSWKDFGRRLETEMNPDMMRATIRGVVFMTLRFFTYLTSIALGASLSLRDHLSPRHALSWLAQFYKANVIKRRGEISYSWQTILFFFLRVDNSSSL